MRITSIQLQYTSNTYEIQYEGALRFSTLHSKHCNRFDIKSDRGETLARMVNLPASDARMMAYSLLAYAEKCEGGKA